MKIINTKTEKTVNYTPAMEAVLIAASKAAPINYAKAKALGIELNRNARSIIAKVKRMNLRYEPMPTPVKKAKPTTKAQYVVTIEKALDSKLLGLEKAPVLALQTIIAALAKMAMEMAAVVEGQPEGFEPGDELDAPMPEEAVDFEDGESLVTE